MTKDDVLRAIEDLLESSLNLPDYHIVIDRENGSVTLTMYRCDKKAIDDMYILSEIFNSYSTEWRVSTKENRIILFVK